MRALRLFLVVSLTFLLSHAFGQAWHPADTNQDAILTISETKAYFDLLNNDADRYWQQAQFLWTEGGAYTVLDDLPAPDRWVPTATGGEDYVSLAARRAFPLEGIEVLGLPEGVLIQGQYRPEGIANWLALEMAETHSPIFYAPYIPTPWLSSRWVEIRFLVSGKVFRAGRLFLKEINRHAHSLDAFLDDVQTRLSRYTTVHVDSILNRPDLVETTSDFDRQLIYYQVYADEMQRTFVELRRDGHPDSEMGLIIAEELFALSAMRESGQALDRLAEWAREDAASDAAQAAAGIAAQSSGNCESVRNWAELILKTKERLRLELADDDDSLKKKLSDKAIDKLPDLAEKLGKKIVDGSSFLAKRVALPVTLTLEFRSFINAWSKAMLPKTFTKLRFEFRDHRDRPTTASDGLLEDSPFPSGECSSISFKTYATIASEGFSSAKYLLDNKIPNPDDLRIVSLDAIADPLAKQRQKAIDSIYNQIKDYDLEAAPCVWSDIEVPQTREDPKFTIKSLSDVLKVNPFLAAGFEPGRVGSGTLEVTLRVSASPEPTDNLPATKPFTERLAFPVKPVRIVPEPYVLSVTDLTKKIDLKAKIIDSWEHQHLRWVIYDVHGNVLEERITEMRDKLSDTSARHVYEQFDPPKDFSRFPLGVRLESQGQGCLSGSQPPRTEHIVIHYNKKAFDVTPTNECFDEGVLVDLKATPYASDPEFRVLKWEVITGNAVVTPTSDTTASLQMPDTPEGEIVVRAIGSDDYEGFAYLSTGPCIDWTALNLYFPEQPFEEGQRYQSDIGSLIVGYDGFESRLIPSFVPGFGGPSEVVPAVYALGKASVFVNKVTPVDANVSEVESAIDGVFIALVDPAAATLNDPLESNVSALHTGTYFDEFHPERDPYHFAPQWVDYERVQDFMEVTDDVYTLPVSIALPVDPEGGLNFTGVTVTWFSDNGEVNLLPNETEDGERIHTALIRYSRQEKAPRMELNLSGTVTQRVGNGVDSYSIQSITRVQHHKIEFSGLSTFKMDQRPDQLTFCTWRADLLPPTLPFVMGDCCGAFALDGYEKTRGSTRQNVAMSLVVTNEEGSPIRVIALSGSQDGVPACHQVKRRKKLKEEGAYPCDPNEAPPDPDPDPDPDGDPEGPTPPSLENTFTDSPIALDGAGRFPNATLGTRTNVVATVTTGPNGFTYPYAMPLDQEIYLGTFSTDGVWQGAERLLDADAYDQLGEEIRLVAWMRVGLGSQHGLLVQRQFGGRAYLDFWERDSASRKLIGRSLATLPEEVRVLAAADFTGDSLVDYLALKDDDTLILYPGTADGIGAAEAFTSALDEFVARSAALLPNGSTLLAADNPAVLQNRLQVLSPARVVSATYDLNKPNFVDTPRAMADFNADGVPDLVTQAAFFPNATIQFLKEDGSPNQGQTLTLSNLPFGAELPGAPFF